MSITITNETPENHISEECVYTVKIAGKVISVFRHNRERGLAQCLRDAADAVDTAKTSERPRVSSDLETVLYRDKSARMPRGQMKLMSLLVQRFGHTVTHEAIAQHLWGGEDGPNYERQTVSAQLNTIRRRIKPAGLRVTSVWGTGYRLEPLDTGASA